MRSTAALVILGFSLCACLSSNSQTGSALHGSEWKPRKIGGIAVPSQPEMFIRFGDGGRLEGHGGCNGFFGSYTLSGDEILIGPVGATRMACPDPIMEHETRFLQALANAQRFMRDRIDLLLIDDAGKPIVRLVQIDAD